jgi:hypothetical protein
MSEISKAIEELTGKQLSHVFCTLDTCLEIRMNLLHLQFKRDNTGIVYSAAHQALAIYMRQTPNGQHHPEYYSDRKRLYVSGFVCAFCFVKQLTTPDNVYQRPTGNRLRLLSLAMLLFVEKRRIIPALFWKAYRAIH